MMLSFVQQRESAHFLQNKRNPFSKSTEMSLYINYTFDGFSSLKNQENKGPKWLISLNVWMESCPVNHHGTKYQLQNSPSSRHVIVT